MTSVCWAEPSSPKDGGSPLPIALLPEEFAYRLTSMTRLILTADSSAAGALKEAGHADLVIPIELRLVWRPLPSDAELALVLAARTSQKPGDHWLDPLPPQRREEFGIAGLGLLEVLARFETIELWMETDPNSQLVLIWLLDYLHANAMHEKDIVLRHVDSGLGDAEPKHLAKWMFQGVRLTSDHFETARLAWRAYRESTPRAWFNLLNRNLSILPQLRRCVLEMLEELPGRGSGLSASEMRILELISAGYVRPFDVFPHFRQRFQRRTVGYWEAGALLVGLALAPNPAVLGIAEWPFTVEMHDQPSRLERYKASQLSLTSLGKEILAGTQDFSQHNPIDRWWGGTHLTNDRLWRWDPVLIEP